MYKAIRITDPQKQLLIDGKDGKTTDETEQVKIIPDHYRNILYNETTTPMKHIPPKEMLTPFTQEETKKATICHCKTRRAPERAAYVQNY